MGSLRFTILAWLFVIAGCATSYQPFDGKTGVSELRVGDERYRVEYHGDPNSGFEQARDFVLLRGAEVMSELGCRHFSVTSRREETRARVASASKSTRVTITAPTGDPSIVADYSTITRADDSVRTTRQPWAAAIVQCAHPDATGPHEFLVTVDVLRSLRSKYALPPQ